MDRRLRLRLARLGGAAIGVVLLYAPFALLARAVASLAPWLAVAQTRPDVHAACLRMPIQGIAQPWFFGLVPGNPLYLLALVLPAVALFSGPLFCGWLCPSGALTEHLSRLVPESLKIDLGGLPTAWVRYGFLAGFLAAPLVSSSICCSFCAFLPMQGLVSAATGDLSAFRYWSSTGIVTGLLWLVFLGVLTVGGRGWCTTMCPVGAAQSLMHSVGSRLGWSRRMVHDPASCAGCGSCEAACPTRAIVRDGARPAVDLHLCNVCLECREACPNGALRYERPREGAAHAAR